MLVFNTSGDSNFYDIIFLPNDPCGESTLLLGSEC